MEMCENCNASYRDISINFGTVNSYYYQVLFNKTLIIVHTIDLNSEDELPEIPAFAEANEYRQRRNLHIMKK